MELLNELIVRRRRGDAPPAAIQLLAGDLSEIPPEHAVDLLVVSAFPESYTPNEGTLFESLQGRGLDMRSVAQRKAEDERARLGCWLSKPLPTKIVERFHFKRILCFEPRDRRFLKASGLDPDKIEDAVGFVFRCLNYFILQGRDGQRRYELSKVALPLLATGNQGVPVEHMLPRLLESAHVWLEDGLPIEQLKVVAFRGPAIAIGRRIFGAAQHHTFTASAHATRPPAGTAIADRPRWETQLAEVISREVIDTCKVHVRRSLFAAASKRESALLEKLLEKVDADDAAGGEELTTGASIGPTDSYDVFVSYAHKDLTEVREFVDALARIVPPPAVFFDESSMRGAQWIRRLSDAVQKSRIFVAILSPSYSASPVCLDEFQCAKLKEYRTGQPVIRTVLLRHEPERLLLMDTYSYIDCAEKDLPKLRKSASAVLK